MCSRHSQCHCRQRQGCLECCSSQGLQEENPLWTVAQGKFSAQTRPPKAGSCRWAEMGNRAVSDSKQNPENAENKSTMRISSQDPPKSPQCVCSASQSAGGLDGLPTGAWGGVPNVQRPCSALSSVQSLSHVQLFVTPRTAAHQASLSITNSQSLLKLMSIESVMPSNHLILCCPLLLHLQSFPASGSFPLSQFFVSGGQSIGVSASASVLPIDIQD